MQTFTGIRDVENYVHERLGSKGYAASACNVTAIAVAVSGIKDNKLVITATDDKLWEIVKARTYIDLESLVWNDNPCKTAGGAVKTAYIPDVKRENAAAPHFILRLDDEANEAELIMDSSVIDMLYGVVDQTTGISDTNNLYNTVSTNRTKDFCKWYYFTDWFIFDLVFGREQWQQWLDDKTEEMGGEKRNWTEMEKNLVNLQDVIPFLPDIGTCEFVCNDKLGWIIEIDINDTKIVAKQFHELPFFDICYFSIDSDDFRSQDIPDYLWQKCSGDLAQDFLQYVQEISNSF